MLWHEEELGTSEVFAVAQEFGLGNQNHLYNHHPFKVAFQGGTIPKCKLHFLGPPLTVKLVAERPPGVVFVGKVFEIPSKCKLTFSRPPSKHLEKRSLHFGYVPRA